MLSPFVTSAPRQPLAFAQKPAPKSSGSCAAPPVTTQKGHLGKKRRLLTVSTLRHSKGAEIAWSWLVWDENMRFLGTCTTPDGQINTQVASYNVNCPRATFSNSPLLQPSAKCDDGHLNFVLAPERLPQLPARLLQARKGTRLPVSWTYASTHRTW